MHLIDVYDCSITCFSLSSFIRYFKRELLPLGAIVETQLPQYFSSWTDKNSPQRMYTVYLVRLWSIAHLKACYWYIECGKAFCQLRKRMPRRLVIKLTHRVLPWGLTKVRYKRMRWRWTSIYFPRRRRTRFSTREKGMLTGPRLRLIRRPRGPRTRRKGMPRKVGD
jgi:hypothetical protein